MLINLTSTLSNNHSTQSGPERKQYLLSNIPGDQKILITNSSDSWTVGNYLAAFHAFVICRCPIRLPRSSRAGRRKSIEKQCNRSNNTSTGSRSYAFINALNALKHNVFIWDLYIRAITRELQGSLKADVSDAFRETCRRCVCGVGGLWLNVRCSHTIYYLPPTTYFLLNNESIN